ncbi:RNA polymerase sigma-70 factor (ECF subfamily) [Herbihabitans rhizosphaerae]|uniref:RNA polymerase sigma-70 factor (ECF subfamily) n=1 Tax=Herbihabitans rhizosphaerae TaxID=1872711 RepID=A0A4Q7KIT9_9PSEU|nr:RNA polymerase sigma factor [Herbihabitans rhizosphaerae]RZS34850.1 RNA polymerase sigma-70 factor (ECF subfamily) [Herbihabitans rhizosphaerae]
MTTTDPDTLPSPMLDGVRAAHAEFLTTLDPHRPTLYRYCRHLTGNAWDAEDLVQETLTRAFSYAAQSHQAVRRPWAWLARIATNAHIDGLRRPAPTPVEVPDSAAPTTTDPTDVRDALTEATVLLPPQERAALVLKDVFDLPLKEIAAMLRTSLGAVKAALHRARGRLANADRAAAKATRTAPDRAVVDALATAFSAYDIDALTDLFLTDATSEVVGLVHEVGRERIRSGSLHHTLVVESDVRYRAEVRELDGEPVILMWARPATASEPEAVEDVLRVDTADGGVARLRWYYFCPETLIEVTDQLGVPCRDHGYRFSQE